MRRSDSIPARPKRIPLTSKIGRPLTSTELRAAHLYDLAALCNDLVAAGGFAIDDGLPGNVVAEITAATEVLRRLRKSVLAEVAR